MKIGLIQIQRLGDLIIALPIAQWFIDRGHEVYWPVHPAYLAPIQAVAPEVRFLPLDLTDAAELLDIMYKRPKALLTALGCERIIPLYAVLEGAGIIDRKLAAGLKFDEYKYARAGVPFGQKWALRLQRNPTRELALHRALGITRPYICVHNSASDASAPLVLPPAWLENFQIVEIRELTDNPFDWLYTIEQAAKRVMIDSSFANMTEQLNIGGENYLIVRSVAAATPVYKNGWTFCWPFDPIPASSDRLQKNLLKIPGSA